MVPLLSKTSMYNLKSCKVIGALMIQEMHSWAMYLFQGPFSLLYSEMVLLPRALECNYISPLPFSKKRTQTLAENLFARSMTGSGSKFYRYLK